MEDIKKALKISWGKMVVILIMLMLSDIFSSRFLEMPKAKLILLILYLVFLFYAIVCFISYVLIKIERKK
jgi:hypothetical protein